MARAAAGGARKREWLAVESLWMVVALGAGVAGFVQGLSGFAFGMVAMSLWAWVLPPQLNMLWFKALLGGLLVLWCPVMLLAPRWPALVVGGRWGDGLAGLAGGVLGGVGGFTGVVPTLWCTLRGYPKEVQRAVIQNFNLSMLLVTMGVYVGTGVVTREMLPLCAVVAPAMLLPTWLGTRLYIGISEARFRQLVLGLLTLSGCAMLAAALPQLVMQL